ncbi:uncharacterized protein N7511_007536 [Penicillium nucicola]|uniref:uncharacterized protein n=1 Tax=Penicillium nucicola TaxID=1850975 RepID=UPI0025452F77|nr:uncharacterized protein N7511_007536 [Penicillium nucicola]KAJ5753383.1 hypothetical protein N7511_007536 [Penicillium nucicola]
MSPDLNSLPPSRSSSISSSIPYRNMPSISPSALPTATATSPRPSQGSSIGRLSVSERRRSAAGGNLNLSEMPANNGDTVSSDHRSSIGHAFRTTSPSSHGSSPVFATADPHHQRAPSLGELHQELEQEQEAQVNRLLQMIRSQQAQLQQYQQQNPQQSIAQSTAIDDTPSSERSAFLPPTHAPTGPAGNRLSISSSFSNRRPSRPSSQTASPNLRPLDTGVEAFPGFSPSRRGSRDESAFYQAEASSLGRENILLRQRIRELERQIGEMSTSGASTRSGVVGQAGPEARDPPAVGSADGKD